MFTPTTFVIAVSSAIVLFLTPTTASAQTAAEEIQKTVRAGQKVSIMDDQDRESNGRIGIMTTSGLTVLSRGTSVVLPYAGIVRIDRPHDTLANGALIGFAVGAALGMAVIAADDSGRCDPAIFICPHPGPVNYLGGAAIVGGLGAAVGVGVDALIHRDRNIYRRGGRTHIAVSPAFGRGFGTATLAISWAANPMAGNRRIAATRPAAYVIRAALGTSPGSR